MSRQGEVLKIVVKELMKHGVRPSAQGYTGGTHQKVSWLSPSGIVRYVTFSASPSKMPLHRIRADVRRVLRQDGLIPEKRRHA